MIKTNQTRILSLLAALFLLPGLILSQDLELNDLKIRQDGRYIVKEDNSPFFWLGDTAWELIHRLDREEIDAYLEDRAEKGFTVVQTVILAELDGLTTANAYGHKPLNYNDPTKWNEDYFSHVDYVLSKAEEMGLYVGLLPTWGDKFNKRWGVGPEIFNPENARAYGSKLASRYKNRPNLIWILGGDRNPETENHFEIIRAMAEGILSVDQRHLISYHPKGGTKATDFFTGSWLDIDMYQSGHSSKAREYTYVNDSRESGQPRPIVNGEARYENIPDRFWEEGDFGWLDEADVRVSAYWSMMAGAAGYTYGCHDIWQMYESGREPQIKARTGWKTAMDLPGSSQMGFMRSLFEKLPWQDMKLRQDLILSDNEEDENYALCTVDSQNKTLLAYLPMGKTIKLDLSAIEAESSFAYWFNPRSGETEFIGTFETSPAQEFTPWSNGRGSDFLLIVSAESFVLD